jgi:hypothetical protein
MFDFYFGFFVSCVPSLVPTLRVGIPTATLRVSRSPAPKRGPQSGPIGNDTKIIRFFHSSFPRFFGFASFVPLGWASSLQPAARATGSASMYS